MDDNNSQEFKTTSPVLPPVVETPTYLFGDALKELQNGHRISRFEWGNTDIFGVLRFDEGHNCKVLMLHKEEKDKTGSNFWQWIISEADLFADDWIILPEGN